MRFVNGHLTVSPTDLANFLVCRHKSALDLRVARGELAKPRWKDPLVEVLRDRGQQHEQQYVDKLRRDGLTIIDLGPVEYDLRVNATLEAMRAGGDVIVQAALLDERWSGYADVLKKVKRPSPVLGDWSYEPQDTKLSRETRGGTILQLSSYAELVGRMQGLPPELFHVITPLQALTYRVEDYGAFYRQAKTRFLEFVTAVSIPDTYPEPTEHCPVCRWFSRCDKQRRADDHLSQVCGLGRQQRTELATHGITTMTTFAATPVPLPFKPSRGAVETYARFREQARLQVEQRTSGKPTFELLAIEQNVGLSRLPEPRPGDLFLDLEGDPFARPRLVGIAGESNREYLFGLGRVAADGSFAYTPRWAFTDAEEREAFEAVVTDVMAAMDADPAIHIYHFAPYEPTALKRLMGRYASREQDLDRLLRGHRFVDLHAVVRHALRAGVERYSIKDLEAFYEFRREVELGEASDRRRIVELALETNSASAIASDVRATVEGYNKDDCRSLVDLRRWLEALRANTIADGADIARPPIEPGEPKEDLKERQQRIVETRERLLIGAPLDAVGRTGEQQARYLLAYLLDWHFREDKAVWWDYFRLVELPERELTDEPAAVTGLRFLEEIGQRKKSFICRYSYPPQEIEIRPGDELKLKSELMWGEVHAHDRVARTIDVVVGPKKRGERPTSAFVHTWINPKIVQESLLRIADDVLSHIEARGVPFDLHNRAAAKLLLGIPPRAISTPRDANETTTAFAVRIVQALDADVLAIQGPPGTGKTFTGAAMIARLVALGQKVGVVATGHKVISKLLRDAVEAGAEIDVAIQAAHKCDEGQAGPSHDSIEEIGDNPDALAFIAQPGGRVLGGTAWLWARPEFAGSVDVLFIDEAGQMSLANALAVSQAGKSLVLLGDPQQLEQPLKGTHPDGVGVSVLEHILGEHKTMPADRGLFLPTTWRLAPAIDRFTSEVFYENKLQSKPDLERQRLVGCGRFSGAGLFYVPADHDDCRSASDQEAELVEQIVSELLTPGSLWIDRAANESALSVADILIVAPYNAHVARLQDRLAAVMSLREIDPALLRIGTVDKFQGQEAAVAIYSMATSRPEDAPRGLEFLYSLNRLNVATSRARCASILVASPRLFEPDCRTPRQMQLANALCRFREMARVIIVGS